MRLYDIASFLALVAFIAAAALICMAASPLPLPV